MSRWTNSFESSISQSSWPELKIAATEASIDDVTVLTSVEELARLKKAMGYIDGIVSSLDPEFVPLTVWTNFNSQVSECLQQLKAYKSSRNIGQLEAANAHLDNILSYIRPYMVVDGKIGNALQSAAKEYSEVINHSAHKLRLGIDKVIEEIVSSHTQGQKLAASLRDIEKKAQELQATLFGTDDVPGGMEEKIKLFLQEADDTNSKIGSAYKEIVVGSDDTPSIKTQVSAVKDQVIETQTKIIELMDSATTSLKALDAFYEKIFGKKAPDSDKFTGGLKNELEERIVALSDFEKLQATRYGALNKQIEDLLPGATSAGLASAYQEMKISFDDPIKFYTRGFYVCLIVLFIGSLIFTVDSIGGTHLLTFSAIGDWDEVLKRLVNKLPFYGPVLWLAYFFSKRRSESQRLQQEYAHKEALAKSYDSYKKQILALDETDVNMQKDFIAKTIDAIAYNASVTLESKHGDKMPAQELIEKVLDTMAKKKISAINIPD